MGTFVFKNFEETNIYTIFFFQGLPKGSMLSRIGEILVFGEIKRLIVSDVPIIEMWSNKTLTY